MRTHKHTQGFSLDSPRLIQIRKQDSHLSGAGPHSLSICSSHLPRCLRMSTPNQLGFHAPNCSRTFQRHFPETMWPVSSSRAGDRHPAGSKTAGDKNPLTQAGTAGRGLGICWWKIITLKEAPFSPLSLPSFQSGSSNGFSSNCEKVSCEPMTFKTVEKALF